MSGPSKPSEHSSRRSPRARRSLDQRVGLRRLDSRRGTAGGGCGPGGASASSRMRPASTRRCTTVWSRVRTTMRPCARGRSGSRRCAPSRRGRPGPRRRRSRCAARRAGRACGLAQDRGVRAGHDAREELPRVGEPGRASRWNAAPRMSIAICAASSPCGGRPGRRPRPSGARRCASGRPVSWLTRSDAVSSERAVQKAPLARPPAPELTTDRLVARRAARLGLAPQRSSAARARSAAARGGPAAGTSRRSRAGRPSTSRPRRGAPARLVLVDARFAAAAAAPPASVAYMVAPTE